MKEIGCPKGQKTSEGGFTQALHPNSSQLTAVSWSLGGIIPTRQRCALHRGVPALDSVLHRQITHRLVQAITEPRAPCCDEDGLTDEDGLAVSGKGPSKDWMQSDGGTSMEERHVVFQFVSHSLKLSWKCQMFLYKQAGAFLCPKVISGSVYNKFRSLDIVFVCENGPSSSCGSPGSGPA